MYQKKPNPRRFYRDKSRAILGGVCAGLADYFGFQVGATRFLYVVASFMFPIFFLGYIGMWLLVPAKPEDIYEDVSVKDEAFWQGIRQNPKVTLSEVRHSFREMEARLQRMERYVTSPRFSLDQEFEDLRNK